jgi:hypothetical protein
MVGEAGTVHPPAAKLDDKPHIHPPQQDRVDGDDVTGQEPLACWRRNDRQLVWPRRGAGSRPWTRRILRIELADTRQLKAQQLAVDALVAHRGFLRASRTMSCWISSGSEGPPVRVAG